MKRIKLALVFVLGLVVVLALAGACTVPEPAAEPAAPAPAPAATEEAAPAAPVTNDADLLVNQPLTHKKSDEFQKSGMEVAPTEKKSVKLGWASPNPGLYHQTAKKGADEAIATLPDGYDIELIWQVPTSDSNAAIAEQVNIIETWVNAGEVDAIATCPVQDDAMLEPAFKVAMEKGIPVFEYGVDLPMVINQYFTSCIIYSQVESSKAVGAWVKENYADVDLKICVVAGPPGPYADARAEGFAKGLEGHKSYEFLASQSGEWQRDISANAAENMLTAHPDTNLIFCHYDEMAMGAISACINRGMLDQVAVVGYDMNTESLEAVKEGLLKCSVYNGTKEAGQDVIKAIKLNVMDGKPVEKLYLYPPYIVSGANVGSFDENLLKLD